MPLGYSRLPPTSYASCFVSRSVLAVRTLSTHTAVNSRCRLPRVLLLFPNACAQPVYIYSPTANLHSQLEPGGSTSTTGGEFGTQCLMDAIAKWENVTTWDASTQQFVADPPPGRSWEGDMSTQCRYCFTNFTTDPLPKSGGVYDFEVGGVSADEDLINVPAAMINTTEVLDGCNCMGVFPVVSLGPNTSSRRTSSD